jgi:membrane protein YqaA with SNARE-associated domain
MIMKKPSTIRIVGLAIFLAILLFIAASLFLDEIKSDIFMLISVYGYLAMFLIVGAVELLPQPLGPEVAFLASNVLKLNVYTTLMVAITASMISSHIDFYIGKQFYSKVCRSKNCEKYLKLYKKYGRFALLISALGPLPYVLFCWISGAFGMTYKRFFFYALIPRIIRITVLAVIISSLFSML